MATPATGNKRTVGKGAQTLQTQTLLKNATEIPGQPAWTTVTKKGEKGKRDGRQVKDNGKGGGKPQSAGNLPKPNANRAATAKSTRATEQAKSAGTADDKVKPGKRKLPRCAAVTLTSIEGGYDDLIREARTKIDLSDLGLTAGLKPKRAQTGALIIEVPGRDNANKADLLADRLSKLYEGRPGIKVTRPFKSGEFRVLDLEDSTTQEEVAVAVAQMGGCPTNQVQVGPLRKGNNGLNTAWVKCPLAAFNAAKSNKLQVGWFTARVQFLDSRPLQCFRCLEASARAK
ncbi:Cellular nucleic acid-binding protein [Temnothorax longispinosus]|uniref:Cellular nucleic acid-binding protein n=1 Tax=Temnothorax longispinosus TaxID=300112 RepID=A0A4S2KP14_9HYME|nr:Cellular nucleic acid-binding protein [Temnothorax longispinosus]